MRSWRTQGTPIALAGVQGGKEEANTSMQNWLGHTGMYCHHPVAVIGLYDRLSSLHFSPTSRIIYVSLLVVKI